MDHEAKWKQQLLLENEFFDIPQNKITKRCRMPFPNFVREEALVKAQRHCCVCHEFAGRSINVHHIQQEANCGANTADNAIVLCLRCHAEAGHFNSQHPLGTKYSPSELIKHRDAWFDACENGTAKYSSNVEVRVKRTYTTSDLHKYILLFTFHNGNEKVVTGWKLDPLIPCSFEVSTSEIEKHPDVIVSGKKYKKYQISNTEALYLGESGELTDPDWVRVEYDIDHNVYINGGDDMKIIWCLYSSAEPPIKGEITWEELQQF